MAPPVHASLVRAEPSAAKRPLSPAAPRPAPALRAIPRPDPKPTSKSEPATEVVRAEVIELDVAPDPEPPPTKSPPPPLLRRPTPGPEAIVSPPVARSAEISGVVPVQSQRPDVPSVGGEMDSAFLREAANDSVAWEPSSLTPLTTDERFAFKMTDEARLRRAYLAKYVKAVVAGCALLCLAAAIRRGASAASQPAQATFSQASTVVPPVLPVAPPPPAPVAAAPVAVTMTAPTKASHAAPRLKPTSKPRRPQR